LPTRAPPPDLARPASPSPALSSAATVFAAHGERVELRDGDVPTWTPAVPPSSSSSARGCGMCVVLLSTYDAALGVDSHAVASSCLTLVHRLHHRADTTTEGLDHGHVVHEFLLGCACPSPPCSRARRPRARGGCIRPRGPPGSGRPRRRRGARRGGQLPDRLPLHRGEEAGPDRGVDGLAVEVAEEAQNGPSPSRLQRHTALEEREVLRYLPDERDAD
jgi:hypothetical protein